jgi:hypothetical protein
MEMRQGMTVGGEPVDRLRAIVESVTMTPLRRGGVRVSGRLSHDDGACLLRALMRVEAELLLHDAERVGPLGEPRTPAQRRSDAFVALTLRVADAFA